MTAPDPDGDHTDDEDPAVPATPDPVAHPDALGMTAARAAALIPKRIAT